MDDSWPNLFLVGAPRCGTTSLFSYLGAHPGVFAPVEKEPHYYDRDILGGAGPTRDAYRHLFAGSAGHRWRLDATATYLFSPAAPGAVLHDAPDARIVVALRDETEFLASWHALLLASGAETIPRLADALAAEHERKLGRDLPPRAAPPLLAYTALARFDEHIDRWRRVFGPDRVHVLRLENLAANPGPTCRALLAFLGLEPIPDQTFPHLNRARTVRGTRLLRTLNDRSSLRLVARALAPPPIRRAAWYATTRALTTATGRISVDADVRMRLVDALESAPIPVLSDGDAAPRSSAAPDGSHG